MLLIFHAAMSLLTTLLLTSYAAVAVMIGMYGGHRLWLLQRFLRSRSTAAALPPSPRLDAWPRVTVQLPMFNEPEVAERAIRAAAALNYPEDRLEIQVLDDSTDHTTEIVRALCDELAETGLRIVHIRRPHRHGYKAGALAEGLDRARGELIAIFDADFAPNPDFLRCIVPHFTDPSVGLVQARWSYLNREASLLTHVQAMFLDGHFIVEQTARFRTGRWFNFNGTAGVWRRLAIEDAGSWSHDTLTEDTDLSYRAQLAGWRFVYRSDITCPSELPETVASFMGQQHRWNAGLMQTGIKLLPRIMRSDASLPMKLEAWFHLTSPLMFPVMLLLAILIAVAALMETTPGVALARIGGGMMLCFGLIASSAYMLTPFLLRRDERSLTHVQRLLSGLFLLPAVMAVGIGMSVVNSRAIVAAVSGRRLPFIRTPKHNGTRHMTTDPAARRHNVFPHGLVETVMGILLLISVGLTADRAGGLIGIPFGLLFASGFLGLGLPMLYRSCQRER